MHIFSHATRWFHSKGYAPLPFQVETWEAIAAGKSGLLNAPTGSGKTLAIYAGLMEWYLQQKQEAPPWAKGLRILWITPLRALSADIFKAISEATNALTQGKAQVAYRSGDTTTAERQKQKRKAPDVLITTPESVHIMLSSKGAKDWFAQLDFVVVDEWHELMGTKRGTQTELALAYFRHLRPALRIWGISATIGNMQEAMQMLLGKHYAKAALIKADVQKWLHIETLMGTELEKMPWAGHMGLHLLAQVIKVIQQGGTTLVFTNTRAQAEIWYRALIDEAPELAGQLAMHHGSLENEIRAWVEQALAAGKLKAVVCTSTLDLGIDFKPVDTIVQVGSPKSVARFTQRAGRSGHRPGEVSRIYFVPTHALELMEIAAIRQAMHHGFVEARPILWQPYDVLIQFVVTLAVGDGFYLEEAMEWVADSYSYQHLTDADWHWVMQFCTQGGAALHAYSDYQKLVQDAEGVFRVESKRIAMRHRLGIGAIVSDAMLLVAFQQGGRLGHVEEWFVAKLKKGDVFWFAGRALELIHVRDMKVTVKRSDAKKAVVPAWMGGRMPLSSTVSEFIRKELEQSQFGAPSCVEMEKLGPVLQWQAERSALPRPDQLLVEYFESRDGHHLFVYPFEGRLVNEGLASLLAYRISQLAPMSISIAMNDYGFELLCDRPIPFQEALEEDLFRTESLKEELMQCINAAEMARRKFRDIASISGLVFSGFPGRKAGQKQLQISGALLFDVFKQYEPENRLLQQAYDEVFQSQIEMERLQRALMRMRKQQLLYKHCLKPSPFMFPIMVDRLREKLSSEDLEERVKRMLAQMEKA